MSISSSQWRLLSMLALTFSFFLVEIVVGYLTKSTALVADSFHMLSDVIALVIAYLAILMSPKQWSKSTFGWARAEVLGALVNAVFLVALCFSILIEAIKRFFDPEQLENPILVLWVGVAGLAINVVGLFLFHDHGHGHSHGGGGHVHSDKDSEDGGHGHSHDHASGHNHSHHHGSGNGHSHASENSHNHGSCHGHSHGHKQEIPLENIAEIKPQNSETTEKPAKQRKPTRNMNMHGVFLHVLADAIGSVIVIISALIVNYTEWEYNVYVDPALSVIMVCIITYSTVPLLRSSSLIMLQTVPPHIELDSLQSKLLTDIDGILAIHELHVWQLAGDRIIATAHILCTNLENYMKVAGKVKQLFHRKGIHSSTIQPEFIEQPIDSVQQQQEHHHESILSLDSCALDCPDTENNSCEPNKCCGSTMMKAKSLSSVQVIDPNRTDCNNNSNL